MELRRPMVALALTTLVLLGTAGQDAAGPLSRASSSALTPALLQVDLPRAHSTLRLPRSAALVLEHTCGVRAVSAVEEVALVEAFAHAERALADPFTRRLLADRRDFVVESGRGFELHAAAGRLLLEKLEEDRPRVTVLAFGGVHCRSPLARGRVHAFTTDERDLVLVYGPYLAEMMAAGDVGLRRLAGTLVHEAAHVVGFSHPGKSTHALAYQQSVPVVLGCAVAAYPDYDLMTAQCGGQQTPPTPNDDESERDLMVADSLPSPMAEEADGR